MEEQKVLNDEIQEITLKVNPRKKYKINNPNDGSYTVLEINTGDMDVVNRLNVVYPKIAKLIQDTNFDEIDDELSTDEILNKTSDKLTELDHQIGLDRKSVV